MPHITPDDEIYKPYLEKGWTYEYKKRGVRKATYWFDEEGIPRCGANLKDKWHCRECGRYTRYDAPKCPRCGHKPLEHEPMGICMDRIVMDNGRCRRHGGNTPKGLAHGKTIHSKYSMVIPLRLAETFQVTLEDEELLSLRDEIGLTNARIYDLLEKLSDEESGERWRQIKVQYDAMMNANADGNVVKFMDHARKLYDLIEKGHGDYLSWNEILSVASSKRQLVETERKRLSELKQTMTAEQAMAMLSFIVSTIKMRVREYAKEYVEDIETANALSDALLAAISTDISDFLARKSY